MSKGVLRSSERVIFELANCDVLSAATVVPANCALLLVARNDEGAILLTTPPGKRPSACFALALTLDVTINAAQLPEGFLVSISSNTSDQARLQVVIRDEEALETFLAECRRLLAKANDLHLLKDSKSHDWLQFYSTNGDQHGPQNTEKSRAESSEGASHSESDGEIDLKNPFGSTSHGSDRDSGDSLEPDRDQTRAEYLTSALKKRRSEFTTTQPIGVQVSTWNIGGDDLHESLVELLNYSTETPTIKLHAIAFQEMDISTEAYITTSETKARLLRTEIEVALGDYYEEIATHQLVGILIFVFAHKSISPLIADVTCSYVATGILGLLGNKGAVGVKFRLSSTSFAFITAHLAAGQSYFSRRNQDLHYIFKRVFNEEGYWESGIDNIDNVFLCGDLNYRSNTSRKEADEALSNHDLSKLLKSDQLSQQRMAGEVLVDWNESEIGFPPTYKFDPGTNTYDSSEKQRVPSWTDRILVKSQTSYPINLIPQTYCSHPRYTQSDHKPVTAVFSATVETIIPEKEKSIKSEVLKDMDRLETAGKKI